MPPHDGWIGHKREVDFYLSIVNADKDPDGKYLIGGAPPISFMGAGEELVVAESTEYYCGGQPKKLAAGLRTTSYGLAVKVF